jgi:hypothetical protein
MNSVISETTLNEISTNIETGKTNKSDIIKAICLLSFDDSIGQIAESVYPQDSLEKLTIKQITGLGFPETNSILENGENKYIFKIRKSNI